MYWLGECAVSRRIPHREPHPSLSGSVERYPEFVAAVRRHFLQVDHLPVDRFSVAPHKLGEFGWERPLRFSSVRALGAGAFDAPVSEKHLTAGHEIVARAQGI